MTQEAKLKAVTKLLLLMYKDLTMSDVLESWGEKHESSKSIIERYAAEFVGIIDKIVEQYAKK